MTASKKFLLGLILIVLGVIFFLATAPLLWWVSYDIAEVSLVMAFALLGGGFIRIVTA